MRPQGSIPATKTTNSAQAIAEAKSTTSSRSAIKHLAAVLLAVVFLWLAFKNVDFQKSMFYLQRVDIRYLLLIFISAVLSHLFRAARWILLLKPLRKNPISLWNSFCAVVIGYAVNIVVPRGGEVARLVSICKSEDLPWAGVLPTLLIDRLIDIAMLAVLLGATIFCLTGTVLSNMPWLGNMGLGLVGLAVVGLFLLPFATSFVRMARSTSVVRNRLSAQLWSRLDEALIQFEAGTKSLHNWMAFPLIALLSAAMWFCYWLNLYLLIPAFQLNITPLQSFLVFTIGSISVLVPTPGSIGSYHLAVSKALTLICGMDANLSLTFATVLHFLAFVLVNCLTAAVCFSIQSFKK